MKTKIKRSALLIATLALITACAQTSTTTSQKPTSSQKPTTPTTEPTHEKTLTSISVATTPSKTEYELGTKLNLAGAQLKITYSDGTTETVDIKDNMISAVDMNTSGQKTVTVTYKNKTATFKITVKEKPVVVPVSVHFAKEMDHVTIGGKLVLAPVISPAGAELVWHSSNEDIATVADGVVTGHSYGNVVISVTQKGSDEVLATTKVYVLKQSAAPVNWAKIDSTTSADVLKFLSGGTMPNLKTKSYKQIIIDAAVGEDQLTLSGLKADVVKVDGGSATSIIFSGCTIGKLAVTKANADETKPVRVEIAPGTTVEEIAMNSPKAILTVKEGLAAIKVLKEAVIQATAPITKIETAAKIELQEGVAVKEVVVPTKLSYEYKVGNDAVSNGEVDLTAGTATAPIVEIKGDVEKVVNEVKDTKVAGAGKVELVETKTDMTLGMDSQVVATGAATISNTAEEPTKVDLTAGDRINYANAEPTADDKITEPLAVGDHIEVYNAADLTAAFEPTQTTAKIVLAADITDYALTTTLKNQSYTLDLHGKNITYSGVSDSQAYAFYLDNAKFTVEDNAGDGKITFADKVGISGAIKVEKGSEFVLNSGTLTFPDAAGAAQGKTKIFSVWGNTEYKRDADGKDAREEIKSTVTLNGGTLLVPKHSNAYGVVLFGKGATFNINDGATIDLQNEGIALLGNGSKPKEGALDVTGTIMNVNGGTIKSGAVGIYHPQAGTLNMTGGAIEGHEAIYIKSGDVNVDVTGGTIKSTATATETTEETLAAVDALPDGNNNGTDNIGAAIVVVGQDAYTGDIKLNVKGAKIEGICGLYAHNWRADPPKYKTEINLIGYKKEELTEMHIHSSMPINVVTNEAETYLAVSTEPAFDSVVATLSEDHTDDPEVKMVLTNDIQLTGQNNPNDIMRVWRDFTLDGNNHTIKGHSDGTYRQFVIRDKSSAFKNLILIGFGDNAANDESASVIAMNGARKDENGQFVFPFNNPKLALDHVTISGYNRRAIQATAGVLDIRNSIFSCEVKEKDYKQGFDIGEYEGLVTGVIDNCEFFNQGTTLDAWEATAIAVGTGAIDLTISNCNIHDVQNGIVIARYYGPGDKWGLGPDYANEDKLGAVAAKGADVKVINCDITKNIDSSSIRLDEGDADWCPVVSKAKLTIDGEKGKYNLLHFQSFHEDASVDGDGKIIVNDGEFVDVSLQINNNVLPNDIVVINGGTFTSWVYSTYYEGDNPGVLLPNSKCIRITGGTFANKPTDYAYVDTDKYDVTQEGTNWKVTKKPEA